MQQTACLTGTVHMMRLTRLAAISDDLQFGSRVVIAQ